MKKSVSILVVVAMSLFGVSAMSGCETMGQTAGTGAALGGVAGGVIGHQSGRAIEGAVIGALVGAAAGAIVHDVRERRMHTAQETYQSYDYQSGHGLRLEMGDIYIEPTEIPHTRRFDSRMDYAVMGAGNGVPVRERFELLQGDQVLGTVYENNPIRSDGTYRTSVIVELPRNAPAGTYRVTNSVSAGNITRARHIDFQVTATGDNIEREAIPVRMAVVSHD